ncbi:response regulator transcription factor [Caenispirillum salinarum]|uniref:response regulator transcription factor n=1 Tax=Caenispirillum salinarum TaxID=859058 RepID=UPI0038514A6D
MVQTPHQDMPPVVYVVDDDDALRDSLTWLIRSADYEVASYAAADACVCAFRDDRPACLLLDVRMPGMSGLELQEALRLRAASVPIIFITGHGDVPMAVRALKAGAFDFVEKPFDDGVVLARIQAAIDLHRERLAERAHRESLLDRWRILTPRERQTLRKVAQGLQNKMIAHDLDISQKTVEVHRHNGLEKMACHSAADLARMLMTLGDAAQDDAP